jgi:predicted RNA polymerase sigma factor
LPPAQRAVLILREIEGMSYEEIAQAAGCSLGTVMSRLFYARRRLQQVLKAHLADLQGVPKTSPFRLQQGPAFGAVWLLFEVARSLGLQEALGNSRQGKLALWQAIARVLDQAPDCPPCAWPARMPPCPKLV